MSNLPAEPGHEGSGGGSAFADFISRLRPYPPPPGFQATLLYAAVGAVALLIAAIGTAALPTDLEGNGFHAIGASQVEPLLELFAAPSSAFVFLGLVGLGVTVLVGMRRRFSETTGAILAALTMIGVAAVLWAGVGWLLWGVVSGVNFVLWVVVPLALMGFALVRFFQGDLVMAVIAMVIALVIPSALNEAASDPATSQPAGPSQEAAAPPPAESAPEAEPPPVPPAIERQQEQAELREQRKQQKREALTQRRIALEARMDAEYAGWLEVPYVPPCDRTMRRAELEALRDQFAGMKQELREGAQNGGPGAFRRVARDLDNAMRERERALADPSGFLNRYGFCPSGAGAMAFLWG